MWQLCSVHVMYYSQSLHWGSIGPPSFSSGKLQQPHPTYHDEMHNDTSHRIDEICCSRALCMCCNTAKVFTGGSLGPLSTASTLSLPECIPTTFRHTTFIHTTFSHTKFRHTKFQHSIQTKSSLRIPRTTQRQLWKRSAPKDCNKSTQHTMIR